MRFDLGVLDASAAVEPQTGAPMRIAVADIDEDPDQPRREFDECALAELAATIAERGVRQPVSVRPHPRETSRWMLNFGARRLRASILAGCPDVPAFVDLAIDSYDQVIENEQREGLKPLELALFVQRQLAAGASQAEIARRLGKSRSYVTMACSLIDAPDWLMEAYRQGKCKGLTELYQLRRRHGTDPALVERLVTESPRIGRSDLEGLRHVHGTVHDRPSLTAHGNTRRLAARFQVRPTPARPLAIVAELDGVPVEIELQDLPARADEVFVRSGGKQRLCVRIDALKRVTLSRGTPERDGPDGTAG